MISNLPRCAQPTLQVSVVSVAAEGWLHGGESRPLDVLGAELVKQRVIFGARHLERFDSLSHRLDEPRVFGLYSLSDLCRGGAFRGIKARGEHCQRCSDVCGFGGYFPDAAAWRVVMRSGSSLEIFDVVIVCRRHLRLRFRGCSPNVLFGAAIGIVIRIAKRHADVLPMKAGQDHLKHVG